ncbi:MAG: pseudouridine synthase, partial [Erysipelotrichia bacterium]|nr:pseudouridine synthase [Erysipelotrichia bacterium]
MTDGTIRLQKYLAECGIASRRKSEELIAEGKVKVNGVKAQIGDKINPKKDIASVDGRKITK